MSDIRESVDGSSTVRIAGLDAKAGSLMTILFELEAMLADGVSAALTVVEDWQGAHAATFVEEVNPFLVGLSVLVEDVRRAKQAVAMWPESPSVLNTITARWDAFATAIAVPTTAGVAAAKPDNLDNVKDWYTAMAERVPALAANVDLDDVTAQVTREIPVDPFSLDLTPYPTVGPVLDPPLLDPAPRYETETTDPAHYITMPDLSGSVTSLVDKAGYLASHTAMVAFLFRYYDGDGQLMALVMSNPRLADELLAGFTDGEIGAESALVILLAHFDDFDSAITGDTDGRISVDDLERMICGGVGVPDHVRQAAAVLHGDPHLFNLVETMNDDLDLTQRDVNGGGGDGLVSRQDIETFLEFNEHLGVVEQNFDEFDTAADPGGPADSEISVADLEALAGGGGQVAAAASWLLGNSGALTRLTGYEQARAGFHAGVLDHGPITERSVLLLAVDQHVYADDPNQSGDFVDRHFEPLMSQDVGNVTSAPAMGALFDSALTGSDQRGELMQRVIAEVADDGAIHNGGLPVAFANGAAANMSIIDANINNAVPTASAPAPAGADHAATATDVFLREVSRDVGAAHRLRDGLNAYGQAETVNAPDSGDARTFRLGQLGRLQNTVNVAQHDALTSEAEDVIREALENPGLGPTPGSTLNYYVSHVPYVSTANDIADALGVTAGSVLDGWLNPEGQDPLDAVDDAERINRARLAESAVNQTIWVAEDRFANPDEALLDAAAGQPFLDGSGGLKTDPSLEEVDAFREWAVTQSQFGGVLFDDVNDLAAGVGRDYQAGRDPLGEG